MSNDDKKTGKFAWTRPSTGAYGGTEPNQPGIARSALLAIAVLLCGIFAASGLHTVGATERAVVFHSNGGLTSLSPGKFQWVTPILNSITVYNVVSQVDAATASAASQDLQTVNVEVTVQFHPDPTQIVWIHQNIGGDYLGKVIQPAVQEAVKASTAHHTAANIIQERPQVKLEIEDVLQARLSASHIVIDQVSLTNIGFSAQFEKAIEDSQTARQNIILEQNNLAVARLKANQTIVQAQAQADSAHLLALSTAGQQGSTYVCLRFLEKWDGKLPLYGGGGIPCGPAGSNQPQPSFILPAQGAN